MGRRAQDACRTNILMAYASIAVVDGVNLPDVYKEFVQPELRIFVKL